MTQAILSFSIGPVQDFIAAARTTRDLWTGSWLLSWLTAQAVHEVIEAGDGAEMLFPNVWSATEGQRVPLLAAIAAIKQRRKHDIPNGALLACLPNTFVASLPHDRAEAVAKSCRDAVVREWQRIADAVQKELAKRWREGWDARWPEQVEEFWNIRIVALPGDDDDDRLRRLFVEPPKESFQLRMQSLAKLAAAQKQIRHFPSHELAEYSHHRDSLAAVSRDDTRPKCSLLGSLAQMGPIATGEQAQMTVAAEFWKSVRNTNLDGTRIGNRDRLCAVSLVKRFAWPAVLSDTLNQHRNARHFPDIDTICAAEWLELLDSDERYRAIGWKGRHRKQPWSGHWLRWQSMEEAEEEGEIEPDPTTFEMIKLARGREFAGPPPTYFAVVQLDGDNMGELLKKLDKDELRSVSRQLAEFAGECAPGVVHQHLGSLVYAGGDDVLAFVPVSQALTCARLLNAGFRTMRFPNSTPTCSAAVVLAHYKTPLRLVLSEAREAEQTAKREGRDCLAVRVMKRSGEYATAVVDWEQVTALEQFVEDFRAGASDRWAYRFRQQLDSLPLESMWHAELRRLLRQAESLPQGFDQRVLQFWRDYQASCAKRSEAAATDRRPTWPLSFIHLIQAASFLVRGGKE